MLTLAIDTSTQTGRIAVAVGETVIYANEFTSERSHNSQIFAPLETALGACGGAPQLVAVGSGPGSYTGVRIGIAAGLGLAIAHSLPIIAIPSVCAAAGGGEAFTVTGDARRGAIYLARVAGRELEADPELFELTGPQPGVDGQLFTFDATPPVPGAVPTHPSASRLATHAATLPSEEIARLAAIPPEPIYLRAPFVTQPKKPGKMIR